MLALILEDVTLRSSETTLTAGVRFRGGRTETIEVERPLPAGKRMRMKPELIAEIDRLLEVHSNTEVAQILNHRGVRPPGAEVIGNQTFTGEDVARLAATHGVASRYDRLRARGLLTTREVLPRLGITLAALRLRLKKGTLTAHRTGKDLLFDDPATPRPNAQEQQRPDAKKDQQYEA
jgi:hypothetical protein